MDFDEYIVASEPHKRERAEAWKVAIGLLAVDGLRTSAYLQETARRNIEGEISIDEARALVNLHIHPTEEWSVQPNLANPTNTPQAQDKHRTSTEQVQDLLHTDNPNIEKLVNAVGSKQMSVKQMMETIGLKGRDNFLNLYLSPAISGGFVRLFYPDSPRHPRQKYLLTVKGMALYNEISQ